MTRRKFITALGGAALLAFADEVIE